jgi:hypothetical protein
MERRKRSKVLVKAKRTKAKCHPKKLQQPQLKRLPVNDGLRVRCQMTKSREITLIKAGNLN